MWPFVRILSNYSCQNVANRNWLLVKWVVIGCNAENVIYNTYVMCYQKWASYLSLFDYINVMITLLTICILCTDRIFNAASLKVSKIIF